MRTSMVLCCPIREWCLQRPMSTEFQWIDQILSNLPVYDVEIKVSYALLFNPTYKGKVISVIRKIVYLCIICYPLSVEDKKSILPSIILNSLFGSLKCIHKRFL